MFGKKKNKINAEEAFDSLMFPFIIDKPVDSDSNTIIFRYSSGGSNIGFSIDKESDESFDAVYNGGIPFIHVFSKNGNNNEVSHEYALSIREFLDYCNAFTVTLVGEPNDDKQFILYMINCKYKKYKMYFSFHESDMYPSVVKYIINKASEGIYKNLIKGKQ